MNILEGQNFLVIYTVFISFIMIIAGLIGIVYRRNLVAILISIEVILNAINLDFILFSRLKDNINSVIDGQVFALFNILIAAIEITVGLAIIFAIRNQLQTSDIDKLNKINSIKESEK
ncbi:MAG: NADH-quinone oxidoreductase subunit NuoK [bacterium]|nr:NADH-quinone oxidoreductase subunit NuoK [bacterium]